jgi:ATP-dependent protease Clp ATPase subunit
VTRVRIRQIEAKSLDGIPTTKEIRKVLDDYVISQDHAHERSWDATALRSRVRS